MYMYIHTYVAKVAVQGYITPIPTFTVQLPSAVRRHAYIAVCRAHHLTKKEIEQFSPHHTYLLSVTTCRFGED